MDAIEAIKRRRSIRAYLDRALDRETIRKILESASSAPSSTNMQPWEVDIVLGEAKKRLSERLIAAVEAGKNPRPEIRFYPDRWDEPFRSRRKRCGIALYETLGIERGDTEKRRQAWLENYRFFNAPALLIFRIETKLGEGSLLDLGLFVGSVMICAQALGLGSTPMASVAEYPDIIKESLEIPLERKIVMAMAIGYPDMTHPVNQVRTEREPIENFARWIE